MAVFKLPDIPEDLSFGLHSFLGSVRRALVDILEGTVSDVGTQGESVTTLQSEVAAMQSDIVTRCPVGSIVAYPSNVVPDGWLECNGAALDTTEYADLYAVIGGIYGMDGDDFKLPDLRGQFLRGWDNSAGIDPNSATRTDRGDGETGDKVGTKQADEFKSHRHTVKANLSAAGGSDKYTVNQQTAANRYTEYDGGDETRPVNIYVMWIIKY